MTKLKLLLEVFMKTFACCLLLSFLNEINYQFVSTKTNYSSLPPPLVFLIPSLGATIVLIVATPTSPLTQPYNIITGQLIASITGITTRYLFTLSQLPEIYDPIHLSLSLSITTTLMVTFKAIHPPAGATLLICTTGGDLVYDQGYWFVLVPVLSCNLGVILMMVVMHRVSGIVYPLYWWGEEKEGGSVVVVV